VNNKHLLPLLLAVPGALFAQSQAPAPVYRFFTNLGNIDVTLTPSLAPMTVANFISYVNSGAYVNTIFHRLVNGFVAQAGGFQLQNGTIVTTPTNAPVMNEFNVTNGINTIAMAKLGTDPNSATSQWFFNLAANGSQLDGQDGGFTVFGNVTAGASVLTSINKLSTQDCSGDGGACSFTAMNSAFTDLPVSNGNYVIVSSIQQVPGLTAPGFQSAASFASSSLTGISPGEILVIYGQDLGPSQLTTFTVTNGALSNQLAGTQVTFNGKAAPIIYTSAGQVSVISPVSFAGLPSVDVAVSYNGIASNQLVFPVRPANPAIFTLSVSGTGDAAIRRVSDGSIVRAASPAAVGDVLELFGEGYGVATPGSTQPDGEVLTSMLPVPNDPTTLLLIDGQSVPYLYFGGAIINGVLQVNFTVPQLKPGSHQIQLQVGSAPGRTSPTGVTLQTK